MATNKQILGLLGEKYLCKMMVCPRCKRFPSLRRLPVNFKCADIICDFCGYLAQVKTMNSKNLDRPPKRLIAAAWQPQRERIKAGIYFPLFLILINKRRKIQIYYLPTEFQFEGLFVPRKPLSKKAKRSGWQGFYYDLSKLSDGALVKTNPVPAKGKI